jgi:hypothetical protein
LEEIIKYRENEEKERIAKIHSERLELLKPFEVENIQNIKL